MRKTATAIMLVAALGLTACNGATTATNSSGTTATQSAGQVAAAGLQAVANACQAASPIAAAASGDLPNASASTQATVSNILTYFQAACGSASAINAVVSADPSGGNDSTAWVAGLAAGLLDAMPTIGAAIH